MFELLSHLGSKEFFKTMIKETHNICMISKGCMKKMTEQKIYPGNSVFRILAFLPQNSAKPPVLLWHEVMGSTCQAANMKRGKKSNAFHISVFYGCFPLQSSDAILEAIYFRHPNCTAFTCLKLMRSYEK